MFRGIRLVALTAALVPLLLAGCSASAPAPAATSAPAPTVTATPAFASKEEAFAAAEKVYQRYLAATDQVTETHSKRDLRSLKALTTPAVYAQIGSSIRRAADQGVRAVGATSLKSFSAQSVDQVTGEVRAYVCLDVAEVRVVNESGDDVTPSGSPEQQQLVAQFSPLGGALVVSNESPWSGSDVC